MHLEEYHKLAEVEDRMWYFRALHRRIIHGLERHGGAGPRRVLDAGCGTGGFIRALRAAHPDWQCTGLDLAPLACALARARTGAEIILGSILELPFADASFDAVVSADVIAHVEDDARALRELARVARPGGLVLVNAPAYRWLWSYHDERVQARRRYTRPELVSGFEAAGLEVLRAGYANLPVLPLVILRRKLFPLRGTASDVRLGPRLVELALAGLAALEFAWQRAGVESPAGSSVFVVGRRR